MIRAFLDTATDADPIEVEDGEVMFMVDNRSCIIIPDTSPVPEEFVRVPLSVALSFSDRDSTVWVQPSTATAGRKMISDMMDGVVEEITTVKKPTMLMQSSTLIGAVPLLPSLMDKSRHRQKKRERQQRWLM